MCISEGRGAKDVGIRNWRVVSPLSETRGVREESADRDLVLSFCINLIGASGTSAGSD